MELALGGVENLTRPCPLGDVGPHAVVGGLKGAHRGGVVGVGGDHGSLGRWCGVLLFDLCHRALTLEDGRGRGQIVQGSTEDTSLGGAVGGVEDRLAQHDLVGTAVQTFHVLVQCWGPMDSRKLEEEGAVRPVEGVGLVRLETARGGGKVGVGGRGGGLTWSEAVAEKVDDGLGAFRVEPVLGPGHRVTDGSDVGVVHVGGVHAAASEPDAHRTQATVWLGQDDCKRGPEDRVVEPVWEHALAPVANLEGEGGGHHVSLARIRVRGVGDGHPDPQEGGRPPEGPGVGADFELAGGPHYPAGCSGGRGVADERRDGGQLIVVLRGQ